MLQIKPNQIIQFNYVNSRGEFSTRKAMVQRFYYGSNSHHPTQQWFLDAFDLDKDETRTFAMVNMVEVADITHNIK